MSASRTSINNYNEGNYMALSTLLISALCRTRVIYELHNDLARHKVYNSVVEHRRAGSKGLRFDSSWELRNFALSHARDETIKKYFSISLASLKPTIFLIIFVKDDFYRNCQEDTSQDCKMITVI